MRARSAASCAACAAALLIAVLARGARANTLFALLDTGELYGSTDGAQTWTVRSTLPVRDAVGLVAGVNASKLYLASRSGAFFVSNDAGVHWTAISSVPATDVVALGAYDRLMLVTASGSVYTSFSGGSWTAVGSIPASDVVAVTYDTDTPQWLAITRTGSVYGGDWDGATWYPAGVLITSEAVALTEFAIHPVALTASGDVAFSIPGGCCWVWQGTLSQSGMTALIMDAISGMLVASTAAGEVARSPDGYHWTWRGVIGQMRVRALATDTPTSADAGDPLAAATAFAIAPWPNPAHGATRLALTLPRAADASVSVLDLAGREVARPIERERLPAGRTMREWRPRRLARGIYFLRARVGHEQRTTRLVWLGQS